MVRLYRHLGWKSKSLHRRACDLWQFGAMFPFLLLLFMASELHAQETSDLTQASDLPKLERTIPNKAEVPSSQPNVIIIETTSEMERSEVILQVVELLEKRGLVIRAKPDRINQSKSLHAILEPTREVRFTRLLTMIETLRSLGVKQISFRKPAFDESFVHLIVPAETTLEKARAIATDLDKFGDFEYDVQVAYDDFSALPTYASQSPETGTSFRPRGAPVPAFSTAVITDDPNVISFSVGIERENANELRSQFDSLERQAQGISEQLRKPLSDPETDEKLKSQLSDAVRQAFEMRQKLQRAELAEFAKRLQGIQQSIEMREKIGQQIIDQRVRELLDPNRKWDNPTPASQSSGIIKSEWPVPAIFDRQVVKSEDVAPLTWLDELNPEEAVWEVIGIRAGTPSETIVDQGRTYVGCMKLTAIRSRSPADVAGLKAGDTIIALNGLHCGDLNDFIKVWRNTQNDGIAYAMFARDEKIQDAALKWRAVLPGDLPPAATIHPMPR